MTDELDKYRPKNFYKEEEEKREHKVDLDSYGWESSYQIGPETLLLGNRFLYVRK